MPALFAFLARAVLLLAGFVFAASLAAAFAVLVGMWLLRSAWLRLTGRTPTPFVMRVDPRAGFERMRRRAGPVRSAGAAADVTDVEPHAPRG